MKIEMVLIKGKEGEKGEEVLKKQLDVINSNDVISFNLGKFSLSVRKDDLIKILD